MHAGVDRKRNLEALWSAECMYVHVGIYMCTQRLSLSLYIYIHAYVCVHVDYMLDLLRDRTIIVL